MPQPIEPCVLFHKYANEESIQTFALSTLNYTHEQDWETLLFLPFKNFHFRHKGQICTLCYVLKRKKFTDTNGLKKKKKKSQVSPGLKMGAQQRKLWSQ